MLLIATGLAACLWVGLLVVPWRPWSTRERIHADRDADGAGPLEDVTVLVPARDEAECINRTLSGLARQGRLGGIVLVDDQSTDGTGDVARAFAEAHPEARLTVLAGDTPPTGWSGKLWALEQGFARVETPHTLLVDADIELAPGLLAALRGKLERESLALASVMARLHMETLWERLLLPPFIYFFKLLYPFALSNDPGSRVAAAAGGCVLLESERVRAIGGFAALHDAIIDDCTLAGLVKRSGGRTWIGLSQDVRAVRPYATLTNVWNMVARTAFTQLRYSAALLALCTLMLVLSFVVPLAGLLSGDATTSAWATAALLAMAASYLPTVRYYELPAAWTLTLPVAAALFLAMTWTSALRYWRGERSRWKNRSYERTTGGQRGMNVR